jgi:hypothetical protein
VRNERGERADTRLPERGNNEATNEAKAEGGTSGVPGGSAVFARA